ncbi:MAG TPA: NDP-sugar synthase [Dehalococcoidia bacterium]|nr:NDP-sugar synthase [Dehalococcoidia bacterium]
MQAIILVGGEGLRLRPLTCNIPKPMVPVVNKPFLEHMFDNLKKHNINEIILAICYLPDHIKRHFGDGGDFGITLTYAVEKSPLGTGGAVKNAEGLLDDTFVVFNGDIFTDLDLTSMIAYHKEKKAKATIALTPVEDPTAYGVVELNPQSKVKCFIEKPSWERVTTNLINAGTYVLEPEVLDLIPSDTYCMLERGLFPDMVEQGVPFYGYPSNAYWIDIGNPADYLKLHHDILMGKAMARFPGKSMADDIWTESGCNIHPAAKIIGPLVIGRDCTIEKGVRISGPCVIGDKCIVRHGATIDEAILWQNVKLGKDTTIRNSVIGNNSVIGDSTWITDSSIVSDDSRIGSGNKLEHGIRIWPGSIIEDNAISF